MLLESVCIPGKAVFYCCHLGKTRNHGCFPMTCQRVMILSGQKSCCEMMIVRVFFFFFFFMVTRCSFQNFPTVSGKIQRSKLRRQEWENEKQPQKGPVSHWNFQRNWWDYWLIPLGASSLSTLLKSKYCSLQMGIFSIIRMTLEESKEHL